MDSLTIDNKIVILLNKLIRDLKKEDLKVDNKILYRYQTEFANIKKQFE